MACPCRSSPAVPGWPPRLIRSPAGEVLAALCRAIRGPAPRRSAPGRGHAAPLLPPTRGHPGPPASVAGLPTQRCGRRRAAPPRRSRSELASALWLPPVAPSSPTAWRTCWYLSSGGCVDQTAASRRPRPRGVAGIVVANTPGRGDPERSDHRSASRLLLRVPWREVSTRADSALTASVAPAWSWTSYVVGEHGRRQPAALARPPWPCLGADTSPRPSNSRPSWPPPTRRHRGHLGGRPARCPLASSPACIAPPRVRRPGRTAPQSRSVRTPRGPLRAVAVERVSSTGRRSPTTLSRRPLAGVLDRIRASAGGGAGLR